MRGLAIACVVVAAVAASGPAVAGEPTAQEGKEIYNSHCLFCHGVNMKNPGNSSFNLRKFPLSQRSRFFNSVHNGKKQMPAWKDVLSDEQIKALWAYVKTRGKI